MEDEDLLLDHESDLRGSVDLDLSEQIESYENVSINNLLMQELEGVTEISEESDESS